MSKRGVPALSREGAGAVAVEAVLVGAEVHADDVALFEDPIVRDAVHHDFVDGDAGACGEAAVAETARLGAARFDEIVDELIDFARRHAGPDALTHEGKTVPDDGARGAHQVDLFLALDVYHISRSACRAQP